ncbi:FMN reductase [Rhizobium viscosum]|nr:FMN reductase [Rhizobium viscosum]
MPSLPKIRLVSIAGSFNRPSKTAALVQNIARLVCDSYDFHHSFYDLADVGASLGVASRRQDLDPSAARIFEAIVAADLLIVGSPTFKGSYPGLFKHLIDLLDPHELKSKPVIIAATGGGERHALMVEHQLRPLFGFFMAHTLPTAVYASDRDFTDYQVSSGQLASRINSVVSELAAFSPGGSRSICAETEA